MSDHARLSPSAAARWMRCPGSVREEAKYPRTSGPAAIDGTHTHTLIEECLKVTHGEDSQFLDPMLKVGKEMSDDDGKFVVDVERAKRATKMINYVRERRDSMTNAIVWSERKVGAGAWIDRDDIYGTADCIIYSKEDGVLEIVDYKDGMTPVAAEGNPQLMIYALGAILATLAPGEEIPYRTIHITIVQPKIELKGMSPISSHEMTAASLMVFMEELRRYAEETDDPNAPLVPGESQCRWCSHKGSCSALANNVMEEVGVMFNDVSKQAADKNPTEMSDDQIREIVEASPLIKEFLDGVAAEAKQRLESGKVVPGLKLVRGRGTRSWNLSEDEIVEKLKRMGLPKDTIYQQKLLSPAQAEKVKWTKRNGDQKQLSERQIKTLHTNYIKKSEGKLTVVPESDHREAVVMDASGMFDAVTPEPVAGDLPDWMK